MIDCFNIFELMVWNLFIFDAVMQKRDNLLLSNIEIGEDVVVIIVWVMDFSSFHVVKGLDLLLIDVCFDQNFLKV